MSGIEAVRLVTADADRLASFYESALGFRRDGDDISPVDPFTPGAGRLMRLSLGRERIELLETVPPARPAAAVAANDIRFQHFAMIAPDMDAAWRGLGREDGWSPITRNGPQRLPASSGGVTAFKFRDPEGHPLELLAFPEGRVPERWQDRAQAGNAGGTLLGIDHTAIVVSDTKASIRHYAAAGFRHVGGSVNTGAEQAALDDVPDPWVEVTSLQAEGAASPHLELLCYGPPDRCDMVEDADPLATRIVMEPSGGGLRDPDGHRRVATA